MKVIGETKTEVKLDESAWRVDLLACRRNEAALTSLTMEVAALAAWHVPVGTRGGDRWCSPGVLRLSWLLPCPVRPPGGARPADHTA